MCIFASNIGTSRVQAAISRAQVKVLHHNYLVSVHTVDWYNTAGRWALFTGYDTCSMISPLRPRAICYKARFLLNAHAKRRDRIYAILHQPSYGGYNWKALVFKCEAKSEGWYADTGNGFYFGPQFTPQTWHGSGGGPVKEMGDANGLPMASYSVSYIEQIAYNTIKSQGPHAWPNCYPYLY